METKVCPHCGQEFERRENQTKWLWDRTAYCGRSCAAQAANARRNYKRVEPPPKVCPQCGKEFHCPTHQSPSEFNRQIYCSHSCASKAWGDKRRATAERLGPETKVCNRCGATYSRPPGMENRAWAMRRFCTQSCAARAGMAARLDAPIDAHQFNDCDCGNKASTHVWVVQGTADGKLTPQRIYVCADCVDMWLEDGATLKRPTLPSKARLWNETHETSLYHAPAHLVSWHMRKGARP